MISISLRIFSFRNDLASRSLPIICMYEAHLPNKSRSNIFLTMNLYTFFLTIIGSCSCFWTVESQLFFNNTFTRSSVSTNPSGYQSADTSRRFNITLSRTLSYATSQASSSDSASDTDLISGLSDFLPTTTFSTDSSEPTTTISTTRHVTITRTITLIANSEES